MRRSPYYNLSFLLSNRHWHIIKRHFTWKKIINIIKCIYHFKMKHATISSFPIYIKIETTDCCNLKCKYCHDGTVERHNAFLDFNIYTNLIDHLSEYLLEVSLYDQGEPLIDPLIVDYVKYASNKNIGTAISTNFSMKLSDDKLVQLINSGLDYLLVAIDGVTQETYEKYRVGGKLDLVFSNLNRIISLKKQLKSKTPIIEWQMIDFEFNKSEQKQAEILAKKFQVDRFLLKPDCYSTYPTMSYSRKTRCFLLWFSFAVECDGLISACLAKDSDSLYVGDLNINPIKEIWNSKTYQKLRKCHKIDERINQYYCNKCDRYDSGQRPIIKNNWDINLMG